MRRIYLKKVFVILFIFLSVNGYSKIIDGIAAIVNDKIIPISDVLYSMKPYEEKIKFAKLTKAEKFKALKKIREKVLDNLIDNKLIEIKGEEMGYKVTDKEVDNVISNILREQHVTLSQLKEVLAQTNVSYHYYREKLRGEILRARVVNDFVKSKIKIPREEIENYLKKHKPKAGKEKFHIAQIFLKQANESKIKEILELLKEKDFGEVAKEYSEGPYKDKGGDLGFFKKGEMLPTIEKVVVKMKKGDVQVVKTDSGIHIIKLLDVYEHKVDMRRAYAKAEQALKNKILKKELTKWLKQLREKAVIVKKL